MVVSTGAAWGRSKGWEGPRPRDSKCIKVGILNPALSDHKLIYEIVDLIRSGERSIIKIVKNYKNLDKNKLGLTLQNAPLWICNTFHDLDDVQNA